MKPLTYRLTGKNFSYLPKRAVGIFSYNNDSPLTYQYDFDSAHSYTIEVISDSELIATYDSPTTQPSLPNYLAAILSEDRNTIYWLNETNPLP